MFSTFFISNKKWQSPHIDCLRQKCHTVFLFLLYGGVQLQWTVYDGIEISEL